LILQRQIEQRRERRKCLDADKRLSCQKPGVMACRPVEHPRRNFKRPICLRLFQRAAEDDKTILVDGIMNANSATKPRMMPIKNLAKNGPVGVLKRRCITRLARTFHSTRTRRRPEPYIPLVAFCLRHFLADFIICMCEFDFRQAQEEKFRREACFLFNCHLHVANPKTTPKRAEKKGHPNEKDHRSDRWSQKPLRLLPCLAS
jgi:hypothetical protein